MSRKSTRPQVWFAISAALCIGLIAFFSSIFILVRHRTELLQREKRIIISSIQHGLLDHVGPRSLQPPYPADLGERIGRLAQDLTKLAGVFRIKIYDSSGKVIWSDEEHLVGKRFSHEALRRALTGEVVSEARSPGAPEHEYEREHPYFVEVYVPVSVKPGGDVVAVVEAYSDITPLMREVRISQAMIVATAFVSGALLFFILLYIMRRALRLQEALEKEARDAKEYMEKLIESSGDAIISTDRNGNVVLFSKGAEALLGYRQEEVLGRYVTMLYESDKRAREVMRQMRQGGGKVSSYETILRAKDGSLVPVLISASILYDEQGQEAGTVGFSKDLRERKRAEEAVRKSESMLKSLFMAAPIGLGFVSNRIIGWTNEQFSKMTGYSSEELMGKNARILYETDEEYERVGREKYEEIGRRGVGTIETRWRRKDGTVIDVFISTAAIDPADPSAGYVFTAMDITERKWAERELRQAHEALQEAYRSLEQAQATAVASEKMAALGRLTAGVSHEILNPLNVITMRLHMMLMDPEVSGKFYEDLQDMQDQANRIVKIAQDLLYFSRQRHPERSPVDLNAAVRRTLGLLEHDLRLMNIQVELDLAHGLPTLHADQDQLQQVILNLLTNARDVMPEGGRLLLKTSLVEEEGGQMVELRVEDTGPGIPEEHIDKIFDPFFTTKPEGEGTGLGLSICQGIVHAHGGHIWAENVPGGGAAFVIRLEVEDR